jgi:hypothetical protein
MDDIADLSVEQVEALIAEHTQAFSALNLTEESAEDDIVRGEELAANVQALRTALQERADAAQRRADRFTALQEQFAAPEPVVEPAEPVVEPVVAAEAPPLAAAALPSPARRAAARAPEVAVPVRRAAVLTAAADVPGMPNGAPLDDLTRVGEALLSRMRGMPTHRMPETRLRFGAAVLSRGTFSDTLIQGRTDDYGLIQQAGRESRLDAGSLVASGGWCAPSETLYDLCQYETLEGLLDVPEVQVNRGGIRYTSGPDFSDIYNGCGFHLTEAQVISGTAKNCCEVDCPTFEDVRLDAVGVCVKAPLLTNAAYPELVRRYIEGALVAHQHKVSGSIIANIIAAGGAPIAVPDNGTLLFNLDHLEWQATAMRYAYRLGVNASIEVVLPVWARTLLRAELGRRNGVALQSVSDAEIAQWFSVRNLAPQFVYNLQDLTSFPAAQAVPTSLRVAMYPAGSWVKGVADVINLDAVYDSASLQQNMFTAIFVEEGVLSVQRCLGTSVLDIPVCVSGQTAAAILDACMGTAPAAAAASTRSSAK